MNDSNTHAAHDANLIRSLLGEKKGFSLWQSCKMSTIEDRFD
ncbi:hypothetical protein BH18ACI4_BH18ACI4_27920 [soil metagenome]